MFETIANILQFYDNLIINSYYFYRDNSVHRHQTQTTATFRDEICFYQPHHKQTSKNRERTVPTCGISPFSCLLEVWLLKFPR